MNRVEFEVSWAPTQHNQPIGLVLIDENHPPFTLEGALNRSCGKLQPQQLGSKR